MSFQGRWPQEDMAYLYTVMNVLVPNAQCLNLSDDKFYHVWNYGTTI